MKTKNLLIVTLHADPVMPPGVSEWGGTHTYMRELLTELSESDYNIVLITRKVYSYQPDIEKVIPNGKIIRLTLGTYENFDKRNLYELHEITFQQLIKRLNEIDFKPDIIHSVYWNSGHVALRLSKSLSIPYVHSVISNAIGRNHHGASGTAKHRIETEKKVFHNASFIICVAESEKKEISLFYSIDAKKIVVAGQYVHPSFFYASHNEYGYPRKSGINYKIESVYFPTSFTDTYEESDWWNKKVFTYTGRLSVDKGLDNIIETWFLLYTKYSSACPPLWIVGGCPDDIRIFRKKLSIPLNTVKDLEDSGKLIWWGYLDENGISTLYSRTLVLLTHSRYEPGGRVAVEAMCEGIPVIATPNGFAMDIIRNWSNGFLVSYQDTEELFLRMEHFIKQPYLSNILGEKAKKSGQQIIENWDFKNKHIATYEAALNNNTEISTKTKYYYDKVEISPKRMLQTYPYNQILIDDTDILEIMQMNQVIDILSIKKLVLSDASSLFWTVKTITEELYVKIPYDRINNSALWAPNGEHPLVISGKRRYQAEIQALTYRGIPNIIGKDDGHHAIIRRKYNSIDISGETQLKNTINCVMNFYENDIEHLSDLFLKITYKLKNGTGYQDIDRFYKAEIAEYIPGQYYCFDYSLRVELLRWRNYYENLSTTIQEKIHHLFFSSYEWAANAANLESLLKPTLIHGGCDYKNLIFTPETILLDNELIHPGWPGMDFADLFITYTRNVKIQESSDWWEYLFNLLPRNGIPRKLVAAWIILDTYKEAVSEVAQLKPVNPVLEKRLYIMQHLF